MQDKSVLQLEFKVVPDGWMEKYLPNMAQLTLSAFHIGVPPFVSRLALATRHMVAGHTFCIQATGLESTCILTTSLVTDLWVTTFIMLGALGLDLNCGNKDHALN